MAIDPNIANDEKVIAIATALRKDRYATAGRFPVFFGEVARHAPNGNLSRFSDATLDAWADGLRGFGKLVRVHMCNPAGTLTSWHRYNGDKLEKLQGSRDRAAAWRKSQKERRERERAANANRTRTERALNDDGAVLTDTDTHTDTKLIKNKTLSAHAEWDADFAMAWSAYPKKTGNSRADALKAYRARRKEGTGAEALLPGVQAYAAYCAREGTDPKYVKLGATFFGPGQHWEADWGPVESEKIWPYVNEHGVPDPDGDIPNPAFAKLLAGSK